MQPGPEAGATPTDLRLAVLRNGWSPLPVSGKRPTLDEWSKYCRSPATDHEIAYWGRSHGAAQSTGLALGRQAGIDIDVASDPALAEAVRALAVEVFGETPFTRVGRAPKLAMVYRAAPDVVSASYKAATRNGDGLDVLASGRQIVAYGRHVETGLPYRWIGTASPLDARPEAAPVITADQVAEFIVRVEAIMPLGGGGSAGGARKGRGGGDSTVVRNAAGLVSDGREGFLFGCVWRAAHELREAKADLTAEALGDAAWALFSDPQRGAVLEDGRWKKADAAYRAKLTIRRIEAGTVELGARADEPATEPVPPTYPSAAVPVAEARAALQAAVDAHFAAGTGHRAIRIGTGCGKTRAAVKAISADIRRRRAEGDRSAALFLTPTLALADEVAELFRAEGVTARTFRGRTQPDPEMADSGRAMCWDTEGVDLALRLDLTVSTACCRLKDRDTGQIYLCPHFSACGYQRQITESVDVWCGAHDLAFTAPAGLGEVGSVTIDEGFAQGGLRIATRGTTLDDLGAPPGLGKNTFEMMAAADVAAWRSQLVTALRRQAETGGVARRHLVEGGITVEMCNSANAAEWRMRDRVNFYPGMPREARQAAARAAVATGKIGKASAVWRAARDLLEQEDEGAVSGRLVLVDKDAEDGFGKVRGVVVHGIRKVMKRWLDLPILLLDATLLPVEVLRCFLPDVEVVADIEAKAPHARVRQVLGAPTAKSKLHGPRLGPGDGGEAEVKRALQAVRRAVLLRWARAGRPKTLVTAQKDTIAALRALGMPDGIALGHYGALSGLDGFKDVALLIAIGRAMPEPPKVETMAGAMTGLEPLRALRPDKGLFFHDRVALALRMADGTGHPVQGYRHPDPIAEAFRWQSAEGGVLQAIGRARAVNRTAENPVEIEVWSDLALPLTVDEVVQWDDVPAGYEADMVTDGIGLESPSDMSACWDRIWETPQAARRWQQKTTGAPTPIKNLLCRGWGACGPQDRRPAAFRYQHRGERQKWRRGWHFPDVAPDPRAWLEARLGELRAFEIVDRG